MKFYTRDDHTSLSSHKVVRQWNEIPCNKNGALKIINRKFLSHCSTERNKLCSQYQVEQIRSCAWLKPTSSMASLHGAAANRNWIKTRQTVLSLGMPPSHRSFKPFSQYKSLTLRRHPGEVKSQPIDISRRQFKIVCVVSTGKLIAVNRYGAFNVL